MDKKESTDLEFAYKQLDKVKGYLDVADKEADMGMILLYTNSQRDTVNATVLGGKNEVISLLVGLFMKFPELYVCANEIMGEDIKE